MKIMFGGDTHGNQNFARYLVDRAVDAGATHLVSVGDFGYWEHEADGVKYHDDLNRYAHRRDVTVVFVDGNHDNLGHLRRTYTDTDDHGFVVIRDRILYAPRGHRWTWDGVSFLALGGALSVDKDWRLEQEAEAAQKAAKKNRYRRRAGHPEKAIASYAETMWFPDEEITDAEVEAVLADPRPVDVMVTHDKPRAANPARNRKDYDRCLPNQDRVQSVMRAVTPKLLVHGHLHYRYTDWVRVSGDQWTRIEGLGADDSTRDDIPDYDPTDAWMVLDLADGIDAFVDAD